MGCYVPTGIVWGGVNQCTPPVFFRVNKMYRPYSKRWIDVDKVNQPRRTLSVRAWQMWSCNEQRHPQRQLKGRLLFPLASFAQVVAVIGDKDDDLWMCYDATRIAHVKHTFKTKLERDLERELIVMSHSDES